MYDEDNLYDFRDGDLFRAHCDMMLSVLTHAPQTYRAVKLKLMEEFNHRWFNEVVEALEGERMLVSVQAGALTKLALGEGLTPQEKYREWNGKVLDNEASPVLES